MDTATVEAGLRKFLHKNTGHDPAFAGLARLSGGAGRETWTFDAQLGDEKLEGIFRCDPVAGIESSAPRILEFHLLKAAMDAGAIVPEPLWDGDETFPVKFFVMRRVPGEALGGRLIRGEQYAHAREIIPTQLAQSLARIHGIDRGEHPEFEILPAPVEGASPARHEVENYERIFREVSPDPHPVFELAFRWLYQHLPNPPERVLVHGDYRLGNFLYGEDGLRGIIDWELAHWGDPMEDIGWLAVKSWRFGGDKPMAGIGDYEPFFADYEAAGGCPVDRDRVRFWELFGNLKWGVITITQAANYFFGRNKTVEMASIGRRTAETEWELLRLLEQAGI
ncbi:MAG: phosphotransferase family protein [Dehalococcoidia bacterium]|nr:phosphotransferase family protein [Dehalococcoidia bacterium]